MGSRLGNEEGKASSLTELELRSTRRHGSLTVFLLDDDPSMLKATRRLLNSAGWNVQSFEHPRAFLEAAATELPQIAVVDMLMPEMDGLEVQARLGEVSPATRVIILSSSDDPSVRTTALNAGAAAFFAKGVESEEFLAGIAAAASGE
jgi:two-component system response regulator FixJ